MIILEKENAQKEFEIKRICRKKNLNIMQKYVTLNDKFSLAVT